MKNLIQKTIREIIPGSAVLVLRTYKNKSGLVFSYRLRIRNQQKSKYQYLSLKATNERDAVLEAFEVYKDIADSLKKGAPVAADRKKLGTYIKIFMDHMEIRRKNGYCTQHRVVCVRQLLVSLENFAKYKRNIDIRNLVTAYEGEYADWRDKQLANLTGKKLTARSRNNEYQVHRQFFQYLKNKLNAIEYVPSLLKVKVEQTNHPFPQEKYNALLKASRDAINDCVNYKTKWNWMVMRTVILLMHGTGCRVTEAKNLRWGDIKHNKRRDLSEIYFNGKGKERTVTVSNRVYGYLMDLLEFKQEYGSEWGFNETEYQMAFSSWKMTEMSKQFNSWGRRDWYKKIGLDEKEYPLVCFRHKFISDALRQGTHALQIAWYTGTSVAMIQQTYGSITSPELFKQVFSNAPEEALERAARTKWFDEQLKQNRERKEIK